MIALGDITEKALTSVGITKDRVQAVTGKRDCGCRKRQKAMNALGYRWQNWFFSQFYYLLHRINVYKNSLAYSRFGFAYWHFKRGIRVLLTGRQELKGRHAKDPPH